MHCRKEYGTKLPVLWSSLCLYKVSSSTSALISCQEINLLKQIKIKAQFPLKGKGHDDDETNKDEMRPTTRHISLMCLPPGLNWF